MSEHYQSQAGITLVETVVVSGIYALLSVVIFGFAQSFYQDTGYSSAQAEEIDQARRGVTELTKDLREMTYSENGTFAIAEIEAHQIGFYSDIDKDNSVEFVRYVLEGTDFYKRTYNASGNPPVYDLTVPDEEVLLSEFVQNTVHSTSTFFYFDSANSPLLSGSQLTDVRYIETQLIINIDPLRSPGEFVLRTAVAPRNLKDNL